MGSKKWPRSCWTAVLTLFADVITFDLFHKSTIKGGSSYYDSGVTKNILREQKIKQGYLKAFSPSCVLPKVTLNHCFAHLWLHFYVSPESLAFSVCLTCDTLLNVPGCRVSLFAFSRAFPVCLFPMFWVLSCLTVFWTFACFGFCICLSEFVCSFRLIWPLRAVKLMSLHLSKSLNWNGSPCKSCN